MDRKPVNLSTHIGSVPLDSGCIPAPASRSRWNKCICNEATLSPLKFSSQCFFGPTLEGTLSLWTSESLWELHAVIPGFVGITWEFYRQCSFKIRFEIFYFVEARFDWYSGLRNRTKVRIHIQTLQWMSLWLLLFSAEGTVTEGDSSQDEAAEVTGGLSEPRRRWGSFWNRWLPARTGQGGLLSSH